MLVVRAVHTFIAEHGDELEFQAGEQIEILEKDDAFGDGWWRGRNTKGEEGLFPATYISEEPPSPHPIAQVQLPDKSSPKIASAEREDRLDNSHQLTHSHQDAPSSPVAAVYPPSPRALSHHDIPPSRSESPRGGTSETLLGSAAATASAVAAGATSVIGNTIGEIQTAIESITKPESDEEVELGIDQDTRARLAAQSKLANDQRDLQRISGEAAELVYSDESDEEEDEKRKSSGLARGGSSQMTPGILASLNPESDSQAGAEQSERASFTPPLPRSLSPSLPLPKTPPYIANRSSGVPAKPPTAWSIDDVVEWSYAKGFDDTISQKFREHEITGDLLLELDANLLRELDIPQFGKRLRIAQAIAELRRPTSMLSSSSQQPSPAGMYRGMSAPPAALIQSITTPLSTPPASGEDTHSAWSHSRKTSSIAPPIMEPIRENQTQLPTASVSTTSMPASPITPNSNKRESTGSLGHKKGKPSLEGKERLSFFGRTRKPPPATPSMSPGNRNAPPSNRMHQVQPVSPNPATSSGNALALRQIGTPDHAGYMKKKGDRYGSWKTRYFVLKGPHLYYMKSEQGDRVKGHIDLRGARIIVDENTNPGSYGFRVNSSDKPHAFSSSEQLVVREWMKAMIKATIARDYTVAVTSSCNIPTIPLAEAQALAPRPPSPNTRDATQRATRRENVNQLTAHDASVLMSLDSSRRISQNLTPSRPIRDTRRPSSVGPTAAPSEEYRELVGWVNNNLPPPYPKATSLPESFVSGEVIFLLVRSLSGIEPSPPVPPNAFMPENGQPGLPGLFAMMDILIDAGIDTADVSINDIRLGESRAIARLVESIRGWASSRAGVAQ